MAPVLNVLTTALGAWCGEHPLDEKVVLAPSRRVGFQWLDAVARSGQPVFNARADTLRRLAIDIAAPELERAGLTFASTLYLEVLVDGLVKALVERGASGEEDVYLAGLVPSPGLTRTIFSAIRELRLSGVSSIDLDPAAFEVEQKGHEVRSVLQDFERSLESGALADYPMAARLAIMRLQADPSVPGDATFLMPSYILEDLRGLELALWHALPEDHRVILPADEPATAPPGERLTDSMLLRWSSAPATAPTPVGDGTVSFACAVGEANEVREVFRTCVERQVPFDSVEVVCTDRDVYASDFYELATRLMLEGSEELPITFAEGIPAGYSRPGRALAGWLAWAADGYPQQHMVRMIADGLLEVKGASEKGLGFARLGAMLRPVPIGAGLDRYARLLGEASAALSGRIESALAARAKADARGALDDEADEDRHLLSQGELTRLEERRDAFELLRSLMEDIAKSAPATLGSGPTLLEQARYFLANLTRSVSKMDAYASEALLEAIGDLDACLESSAASETFDVAAWLADLAANTRVGGQGPRPGCLHVSGMQQGGHSGRPFTFIAGMDDVRFPGAGLQDALLLDSERTAISSDLPTAARRIDQRVQGFARLCARLRGEVRLSYCCLDLSDDREMFPSRVLTSAFKAAVRRGATTVESEGMPASFAPLDEKGCIDMTEWWLWRTCSAERVGSPQMVIGENFPNLAEGFKALAARASDSFTEYDGYVPEAGEDCDCTAPEAKAISPSRLGALAANPMEYFFRYVLKVEPPQEYEIDPARWLDPLETGTLLHAVFCDFIRGLQDDGALPPVFARDRDALLEILEARIDEKKIEKPPPSDPTVFAVECRSLRNTAESFLQMEAEFCRSNEPVACELAVGVEPEGAGTAYDLDESVSVQMPDGRTVQIRCKLDRVDRIVDGVGDQYIVCDYKTGKSEKYLKEGPFYQGRFMQAVLYPITCEAALRTMHEGARVVRFEYVFPKPSEHTRIGWWTEELDSGMQVLSLLCEMICAGCFAFTTDPADTDYSDYKAAFGDVAAAAQGIERKMENKGNHTLDAYRKLRTYEFVVEEAEQ